MSRPKPDLTEEQRRELAALKEEERRLFRSYMTYGGKMTRIQWGIISDKRRMLEEGLTVQELSRIKYPYSWEREGSEEYGR